MKELLELLNSHGIYLDESVSSMVLISFYYLLLSAFMLFNVINIIIYLLSIYIVSHEKFLSLIPVKYTYVHKLINYYKNIRIGFIVFEFILLLACLIIMISVTYGIVSFYVHYKSL